MITRNSKNIYITSHNNYGGQQEEHKNEDDALDWIKSQVQKSDATLSIYEIPIDSEACDNDGYYCNFFWKYNNFKRFKCNKRNSKFKLERIKFEYQ